MRLLLCPGGALSLELDVVVVAGVGARHVVAIPEDVAHNEANAEADADVRDQRAAEHLRERSNMLA